jgi:hypothetical protein
LAKTKPLFNIAPHRRNVLSTCLSGNWSRFKTRSAYPRVMSRERKE